ncbi:hypothetical protein [Amycolatopsis sp. NPDC059657]|uniref:hypothetical protein n=1 Tax=Amycolatopsis sp. NPDC059657 TaxID=3346899 RepID=UPI003670B4C1
MAAVVFGLAVATAVPQAASAADHGYVLYNKGDFGVNVYFKYNGTQEAYNHPKKVEVTQPIHAPAGAKVEIWVANVNPGRLLLSFTYSGDDPNFVCSGSYWGSGQNRAACGKW